MDFLSQYSDESQNKSDIGGSHLKLNCDFFELILNRSFSFDIEEGRAVMRVASSAHTACASSVRALET